MILNPPPSRTELLDRNPGGAFNGKASSIWIKWLGELYAAVSFFMFHIHYGSGSPENVVAGIPGDLYLNLAGGASLTLWVKESGTATRTGWIAK